MKEDKLSKEEQKIVETLKNALYKKEVDPFDVEVYKTLSLEEKVKAWKKRIWQNIKDSESSKIHLHPIFKQDNYNLWRAKYQDIDIILDEVLAFMSYVYGDEDLVPLINKTLGRSTSL